MDIKLTALDLDDTTLIPGGILDGFTRDTLRRASECGMEIVVASGRAFTSLPEEVLSIPGLHYAISSNGAAIVDITTKKRIMGFTLKPESVRQILDLFPDERFEGFVEGKAYCPSEYYADPVRYGCTPDYVGYVQTTRTPVDDMPAFLREHIAELDSIDILCGTAERRVMLWEKTREIKNVYVTSSSARLIEISDEHSGKGSALRFLAKMLGVERECIAAFGNGDNDADMLKFAGIGVAVDNATDACKEAADLVCESNAENGVAKTIRRFCSYNALKQNTSE